MAKSKMTTVWPPGFMRLPLGTSGNSPTFDGIVDLGRFAATIVATGFSAAALYANSDVSRVGFAAGVQLIYASIETAARRQAKLSDDEGSVADAVRIAYKPYTAIELNELYTRIGLTNAFGAPPSNRYEAVVIGAIEIGIRIYNSASGRSA